jgi:N-acetylneuraminic acid mutarotase
MAVCLAGWISPACAQNIVPGAWTWMGGSSTIANGHSQPGVYGTFGVASAANIPYSRNYASTWVDTAGNLWLFGGVTLDAQDDSYELNDLWEYDPKTDEWTWQAGSSSAPCPKSPGAAACGQPGVYGTKGVGAASNVPGGRSAAISWTDPQGKFWLFGGSGFDSLDQWGTLDDLWVFDPATRLWTWMGGDATVPGNGGGDPGVYGTLGVPARGNNPGALYLAYGWTDAEGNGWAFGGWGNDVTGASGLSNNLWKFDVSAGEWAWMEGSSTYSNPAVHPSVYGSMGTPAPGNVPGSRWNGASWADSAGHLWLFSGMGYDSAGNAGYLNEQWEYDPASQQWTWAAGANRMTCTPNGNSQNCGNAGVYGTEGQAAAGNLPGGRSGALYWTGKDGKFWLFSGSGFNVDGSFVTLDDLWSFDPATRMWTWVGGPEHGALPVYGTQGVAAAANIPGGRNWSATWTDLNGNLWLFGGNGLDANGTAGILNDMWEYQPGWKPVPPDFAVAVAPGSMTVKAGQSGATQVTVTPANGFNSAVSFACTGLPAGATCSFSPETVTPGGGAVSTTLTVQTAATVAQVRKDSGALPLGGMLAAGLLMLAGRRMRRGIFLALMALSLISAGALSGCASIRYLPGSLPPVTSPVTVMATAGSLQHSTKLTVTVN